MIIHNVQQGTDEWLRLRMGRFTASNFHKLFMATSTKGYNDTINSVVFERLTDEIPESFSNEWMQRGKELEPLAIEAYQYQTFSLVKPCGFIELNEWVGASPDGLIGNDGMIQVKCPRFATLIEYILDGTVPKDYMIQMQGELFVSCRKWSHFFVFHPKLRPLLVRVDADKKIQNEIFEKLNEAIEEAKRRIARIQ